MAKQTEDKKVYKPGAYICIVEDGQFAFFNKRKYVYGQRVFVDSQELVDKMMGAGNRFIPESEFEKADVDLIKKIRNTTAGKTIEDVVRSSEAEKEKLKDEYEKKIKELTEQLQAKEDKEDKEDKEKSKTK